MMNRRRAGQMALAWMAMGGLAACAVPGAGAGWTTLVDGSRPEPLAERWSELGEGHWRYADGALEGRDGKGGFLVSKQSYADFELRAEFWADETANSGLFLRAQDPAKISAESAYEVNIFDKRPDPTYGTAAIVGVAKVAQPGPKAAGQWNTFVITARGDHLTVVFNGQKTVDLTDGKHRSGPLALQSAAGTIRFRKVEIRAL